MSTQRKCRKCGKDLEGLVDDKSFLCPACRDELKGYAGVAAGVTASAATVVFTTAKIVANYGPKIISVATKLIRR